MWSPILVSFCARPNDNECELISTMKSHILYTILSVHGQMIMNVNWYLQWKAIYCILFFLCTAAYTSLCTPACTSVSAQCPVQVWAVPVTALYRPGPVGCRLRAPVVFWPPDWFPLQSDGIRVKSHQTVGPVQPALRATRPQSLSFYLSLSFSLSRVWTE